jgi:hypothetical protein
MLDAFRCMQYIFGLKRTRKSEFSKIVNYDSAKL